MCGRSSLTKNEKELEQRFGATFYSDELLRYNPLPNYNVAPTHFHPVITEEDTAHLQLYRWGLVPFWAKDAKIGSKMINARLESIEEKPVFSKLLQAHRCIVPFDGFYEWKLYTDKHHEPYRITVRDGEIFSVAGLWSKWKDPDGQTLKTFTVITHAANRLMKDIHDRMPAILTQEAERLWTDSNLSAKDALQLLVPFPAEEMQAYRVSDRINKVANNDAGLIEKFSNVDKPGNIQGTLF